MPQVSGQSCGQTAFTVVNSRRIPFPLGRDVEAIIPAVRSIAVTASDVRRSQERTGRSRVRCDLDSPLKYEPVSCSGRPPSREYQASPGNSIRLAPCRPGRDWASRGTVPASTGTRIDRHAGTRNRGRIPRSRPQERTGPGRQARRSFDPPPARRPPCPDRRPVASLLVRDGLSRSSRPSNSSSAATSGSRSRSKYRLLELLGAGGMGAVYLCEHTLMRRLVALKVLPAEKLEDQSNVERFYREARRRRRPRPPEHRPRLRHRPVREAALPGHGVRGRHEPPGGRRPLRLEKKPLDPIRAAHYIAQAADRPAARPRARHGSPRHQARQPAARPHRASSSARHGAGPVLQQDSRTASPRSTTTSACSARPTTSPRSRRSATWWTSGPTSTPSAALSTSC